MKIDEIIAVQQNKKRYIPVWRVTIHSCVSITGDTDTKRYFVYFSGALFSFCPSQSQVVCVLRPVRRLHLCWSAHHERAAEAEPAEAVGAVVSHSGHLQVSLARGGLKRLHRGGFIDTWINWDIGLTSFYPAVSQAPCGPGFTCCT